MPVKSIRFPNQTTYDGKITSLTEKEKEVLKKAGIGGGESNINILTGSTPEQDNNFFVGTYSGVPDKSKINILRIDGLSDFVITFLSDGWCSSYVNNQGYTFILSLDEEQRAYAIEQESSGKYYSHFINIYNDFDDFYFTYQNTSEDKLNTLDSLKTALNGKFLLCNGHSGANNIAQYIYGDNSGLIVKAMKFPHNSDSGPGLIGIDSGYTITDDVSPIE